MLKSTFNYRGKSMKMVFKEGDGLIAGDTAFALLRSGDVVCFMMNNQRTVHRLIDAERGITQGDNNLRPDGSRLTEANYISQVVECRRGSGSFKVCGGWRGMLAFRLHHWRLRLKIRLAALLRPFRKYSEKAGWRLGRVKLEKYGSKELLMWHGMVLASRNNPSSGVRFTRPGIWFFGKKNLENCFEKNLEQ